MHSLFFRHVVRILPKGFLYAGMMVACCSLSSCIKNESSLNKHNAEVNDWILSTMKIYYYWNTSLENRTFDMSASSDVFFESLLYKRGQNDGDRFSWYQDSYQALLDNIYAKAAIDPGFAYSVISLNDHIYLQVSYVKPHSNAFLAGLKRGKLISKINGTNVSAENYKSLLNSANLELGMVKINESDSNITDDGSLFFSGNTNFFEQPILMDSLYTLHDSGGGEKKVGYLVYNRFIADPESGSNEYDIDLNQKLFALKNKGAEYFIIDLRYNKGGYMDCAVRLASALIPPAYKNTAYLGSMRFNATYQQQIDQIYGTGGKRDYFTDIIYNGQGNGISIQNISPEAGKLYFLVGPSTASASEILIWGLRAFSSNVMVGSQTRGKFMGSYSLYQENNPNITCGIQPLVCKYYDYAGESGPMDGMIPEIQVTPTVLNPYELGDEREPLLQAAFAAILPSYIPHTASLTSRAIRTSTLNRIHTRVLQELSGDCGPEGAIVQKH